MNYNSEFLASLDAQPNKTVFVKLISLDYNEQPREAIDGRATAGSINIDGASAIRRSCSISLVTSKLNISNYYWTLKTKFKVQVGLEQEKSIVWFDQGIFVISSFSTAYSAQNYIVNIQGKDKMCMLNGELGGLLNSSVCFDSFDQVDIYGVTHKIKTPIKQIIRDAVHQYGGEPFHNILINDLDITGLELQEYRYDTPLYLLRLEGESEYIQSTLQSTFTDSNNQPIQIDNLDQYDSLSSLMGEINSDVVTIDDVTYNVAKIEYGETAGYKEIDLVYPGDLIANIGESITSILDKIKNVLGDYEYFYDVDGRFVFQKKQTYINTAWSPIVQNEDEIAYVDPYFASTPYSYNFTNSKLFTSFNNAPNLSNLKNDFTVWGENSSGNPIHMRYAIDRKPVYYKSISVTEEELMSYNKKYDLQTLGQTSKIYWYNIQPKNSEDEDCEIIECDWREIIFQMQKDYRKYNHLDDFNLKIIEANPLHYPLGITGYEQYYIDIEGFWRYLYQAEPLYEKVNYFSPTDFNDGKYYTKEDQGYESISVSKAQETKGIRYYKKIENIDNDELSTYETILYPYEGVAEVYYHKGFKYELASGAWDETLTYYQLSETYYSPDNGVYTGWNKLVREDPSRLIFWFDFLDSQDSALAQYSIPVVGVRPKVNNDKDVKAIYYGNTPTIIFDDFSDGTQTNNKTGYRYFNIGTQYNEMFSQSAQGKSAKEAIDNMLYNHTYCIESVTIQSIPIYYLQPNTLIYINDVGAGIEGDYIINKLTIPLTYNGMMSINGVKVVPRLY